MNIQSILDATLELCEADLKRGRVTVERRMDKMLPSIEGNASELQQIFLNLVNNAIQAMPKGGTLSVDAKINNDLVTLAARTKGGLARKVAGPWLEISFKDSGVGISKDHLGRVFEPFFTT